MAWRIVGDSLYFVETSLDSILKQNAIKLIFPAPLVPNVCCISVERQNFALRVLVFTETNSLHRFTFETNVSGLDTDSIFAGISSYAQMLGDRVIPSASMHEFWSVPGPSIRASFVAPGFRDESVVVTTRSGELLSVGVGDIDAYVAVLESQSPLSGVVTISQAEGYYSFALSKAGLLSGYALSSGGSNFVSVQLEMGNQQFTGRIRGIGLRSFHMSERSFILLALVESESKDVTQFQTIKAEFVPGGSVEIDFQSADSVDFSASSITDFTIGPRGIICLHSDGSVSSKQSDEKWKVAQQASLGHIFPSNVDDNDEWMDFANTLRRDPYVSRFFLRAVIGELAEKGFFATDGIVANRNQLALNVESVPMHERQSVLNIFIICYTQSRIGSSISRIGSGLPILIGPGGISTLFPMPVLSLWPHDEGQNRSKLMNLCLMTEEALTEAQWLQVDSEMASIGPEEACLTAMRLLVNTSVPLELPLAWAKLESQGLNGIAAMTQLIHTLCQSPASATPLWKEQLKVSSSLAGPLALHSAACAIRSGAEGTYRLCRAVLLTLFSLLASTHVAVDSDHRHSFRLTLIPKIVLKLRRIANLRASLRSPNHSQSTSPALPYANAVRHVSGILFTLTEKKDIRQSEQAVASLPPSSSSLQIAPFSLYAWLLASDDNCILLMSALAEAKEFNALQQLSGGACVSCADFHFQGVTLLEGGELDAALDSFLKCASLAERDESLMEFLSVISRVKALQVAHAPDQYWLSVISLFEHHDQSLHAARAAKLALYNSKNPHLFWSKSFRHNLRLKQYSESYLDILAASNGGVRDETLTRRLRKFVGELIEQGHSASLCEFPFVSDHNELVASILLELGDLSDVSDLQINFYEILYSFQVYREKYRDAAAAVYTLASRLRTDSHAVESLALMEKSLNLAIVALRLTTEPLQWISIEHRPSSSPDTAFIQGPVQDSVSLLQLKQECALVNARLSLRQFGNLLVVADAFSLLISTGKVFQALSLGKLYRLDLGPAFEALARRALSNQALCDPSDEHVSGVNEGKSAWAVLQELVIENDSRKSNWSYGRMVAIAVLEREPRLPQWLENFLLQHHPESLMHVYLSFGLNELACQVAMKIISNQQNLLPVNLLDKLLDSELSSSLKDNLKRKLNQVTQVQ